MGIIEMKSVSKSFGPVKALEDVSIDIAEGEFYGLLGQNGAGKTTLLNILNTTVASDGGTARIGGFDTVKDKMACKRLLGVVPQEIALYEELSAYENMLFWGRMYGLSRSKARQRADEILEVAGLIDRKQEQVKTYSGGMKRRINIACALLHAPKLLFLDEPTVGIDPQNRNRIYTFLEKLNADGMTIVYTTHYMEEAERMCDRIGILDHGKLVAEGPLESLRERIGPETFAEVSFPESEFQKAMQLVESHPGWTLSQPSQLKVPLNDIHKDLPGILLVLEAADLEFSSVSVRSANLESIFLDLIDTHQEA